MAPSSSVAPLRPAPKRLPRAARAAVLRWFDERGRALAFRATRDPYAILVSEVMAQQTQISRVVQAWPAFLERFPTVEALAAATPADVVRAWRGMGYDRRALNLRRAARTIVDEHGAVVPSDVAALERLPGIGPYTARAVAAIAFESGLGAVDTNVRRVLGRTLAGATGPSMPAPWLQAAADLAVDRDRPGDWTHAVMDVGATICRPANPHCGECPLLSWCRFAKDAIDAPSIAVGGDRAAASRPAPRPPPARVPATRFAATTRWLRGRIVDRLRAVDGVGWTTVAGPIGDHNAAAVRAALVALAGDGVIELHHDEPARARLAIG
ncbi:MAG: A/G-specific adenine glycosylase [Chloroflexota bacterium]|nr:A/G-specific adenine glycosylase [Chloroflexota bacterium]